MICRDLHSVFRSFNYWQGANRLFLEYFQTNDVSIQVNSYEALCADSEGFLDRALGTGATASDAIDISKNTPHIAMDNKDFVFRNREHIANDARWKEDARIKAMYLIHRKARALNRIVQSLH